MSVFAGLKVVEISQGMSGPMVGMILADFGADVIKVEPPAGDWARTLPGFLMWNRGKRSIALDLRTAAHRCELDRILQDSDIVVVNLGHDSVLELKLTYADMRCVKRELIYVAITGFDSASNLAELRGYEGVALAASGRMLGADALSGAAVRTKVGEPIFVAPALGSFGAAMLSIQGLCAALTLRKTDGRGRLVDTSLVSGMAAATMRLRLAGGELVLKSRDRDVTYQGIMLTFINVECKDGRYIQMCARQDHHFANWLCALGLEELLQDERFAGGPLRFKTLDDIQWLERAIRDRMAERNQAEWMQIFTEEWDVGADPVLTPEEFLDHVQVRENRLAVDVIDEHLGHVRQLGPIASFSRTPALISESAPELPQVEPTGPSHYDRATRRRTRRADLVAWAATDTPIVAKSADRDSAAHTGPLAGQTILELAYFLAAPLGTTFLAELGARVIKIEPPHGDPFRKVGLEFAHVGCGKESLALDLKIPGAMEVLHRLVRGADAFVTSFRPSVQRRLRIDYGALSDVNPNLVYLYASAYGSVGPHANRAAFHSTPNALCGGAIIQAGAGNPPVDDSFPDPCSALAVGAALSMGLLELDRRGRGQYIETTMLCSSGYLYSNDLVQFRGRPSRTEVDADQRGTGALYRLYECEDSWVFLAVVTQAEWMAFVRGVNRPELGADPRFRDVEARAVNNEALAWELEAMFASAPASTWFSRLKAAGVAAAEVRAGFEEFLAREGMLRAHRDETYGEYWSPFGRVGVGAWRGELGVPPHCGDHTNAILDELGYCQKARERMARDGITYSPQTLAPN